MPDSIDMIIERFHDDDFPEPIGLNDYGQPVDKWYLRSGTPGPDGRPQRNHRKTKIQKLSRKRNRK
jgi:hypothetical protein